MVYFDEYLDKAKDLAKNAGSVAKNVAGEVVGKAKELTDDGAKVRELAKNAKKQTSAVAFGAKEKLQGLMQDAGASKELKQGISELQALPEFEGSIVYRMDLDAMISDLNGLIGIVNDKRLDAESVAEEIKRVIVKVLPSSVPQAEQTDEQQAIEAAKAITFSACIRALDAIKA